MKNVYVGCDPGLGGAISVLSEDLREVEVYDFCVEKKSFFNSKVKNQIDIKNTVYKLKESNLVKSADNIYCILEVVGSRSGQSAQSTFSLGDSFAAARACLFFISDNIEFVKPQEWKEKLKLKSKDKQESINLAITEINNSKNFLTRKKDHDRAESILIAYYLINKGKTL